MINKHKSSGLFSRDLYYYLNNGNTFKVGSIVLEFSQTKLDKKYNKHTMIIHDIKMNLSYFTDYDSDANYLWFWIINYLNINNLLCLSGKDTYSKYNKKIITKIDNLPKIFKLSIVKKDKWELNINGWSNNQKIVRKLMIDCIDPNIIKLL